MIMAGYKMFPALNAVLQDRFHGNQILQSATVLNNSLPANLTRCGAIHQQPVISGPTRLSQ
jgi:hypothetical protein